MSDRSRRGWRDGLTRLLRALPWAPRAALAALLAAAAGLASAWHLEREEARLLTRLSPVALVVAARDLTAGTPLERSDLAVSQLPRNALPGGALAPSAIDALEGRRLLIPLRAGDPVLASAVADPADPPPLAHDLRPGRRAVAVPIDPVSAAGGFVEPGDRVDAVLVWQDERGETRAVTLLEALPVLAVGGARRPGRAPTGASTAVVETGPAEAEALLLALERGRVALVLRRADDAGLRGNRRPVSLEPLLPGYRPPDGPAPSVEVIRGSS